MDDKISIIEGPPPVFESVDDAWALGINESPLLFDLAVTRLRTFNGPALVERCHRTWTSHSTIFLHYRNEVGMEERAPILAARNLDTNDGQVLMLWIRLKAEENQAELRGGDDEDNGEN